MSQRAEDYGWTAQAPGSSSYIAPEILRQLRALDAKSVLDAGCGNGSITGLLAREGFAVTGVDGDAGGIAIAQTNHPQVPFAVVDFADDGAALTGAPFDAVVSTEVVEHLYAPHELAGSHGRRSSPVGTSSSPLPITAISRTSLSRYWASGTTIIRRCGMAGISSSGAAQRWGNCSPRRGSSR